MDVIKDIGGDDLKFIFAKDEQMYLLETLYVRGFSEEKYRKLRKYIREKLGEEFSSIVSLDGNKALAKVLLVGVDQVGQSLINDLVDNEIGKANSWIEGGIIKELVDKAASEVEETRKARSKSRKKGRRKKSRSKGKKKSARRRTRRSR
ncbi:hypothetical protein [Vulcanisaeta souniana]|uniref:Uncharacterized protein n=1 Tax=Vulcanisaeta souniana JCM 11219 TaxID=1293586 RepID=A0A830EE94_9CREN|nr:hypothetical protein [Vulcanisaeta souniana]BDR92033.1 hypothetical protein Vsou_11260 [Vulcanisaeta souniana JCM 11219]GGI68434.1 hypothetical protein GCM10007112_01790 [Vulcanisaeta souniana JCM 11219]